MEDPERLKKEAEEGNAVAARNLLELALRKRDKALANEALKIILLFTSAWLGIFKETGTAYEVASTQLRWVQVKEVWHIVYPGGESKCSLTGANHVVARTVGLNSCNGELIDPKDSRWFPPGEGPAEGTRCEHCVWELATHLSNLSDAVDRWGVSKTSPEKQDQLRNLILGD